MDKCKVCDTGDIEYRSVQMGGDGDPIIDCPDQGLCFQCSTEYDDEGKIVRVSIWGDPLPIVLEDLRATWQASGTKKAIDAYLSEKA